MTMIRRWIGGLALVALAGPAAAACVAQATTYQIPAGRMDEALQQFAHTSGCPVKVDMREAGGKQVAALAGRYTPVGALIHLVRGSGLEVHVDAGPRYRIDHGDYDALSTRIHDLRQAIGRSRDAGRLDADQAAVWQAQLAAVGTQSRRLIRQQGFLSTAEKADNQRLFEALIQAIDTPAGPARPDSGTGHD